MIDVKKLRHELSIVRDAMATRVFEEFSSRQSIENSKSMYQTLVSSKINYYTSRLLIKKFNGLEGTIAYERCIDLLDSVNKELRTPEDFGFKFTDRKDSVNKNDRRLIEDLIFCSYEMLKDRIKRCDTEMGSLNTTDTIRL